MVTRKLYKKFSRFFKGVKFHQNYPLFYVGKKYKFYYSI